MRLPKSQAFAGSSYQRRDCGETKVGMQLLQWQRVSKLGGGSIQMRLERHEYESKAKDRDLGRK